MKKTAIILACMALGCAAASAQPKLSQDNIPEIVSALSTEQKACLVVGFNSGCEGYDPGIPGTGGITYPIPQFGIPSIVMMDGPVGKLVIKCTGPFPSFQSLSSLTPTGPSIITMDGMPNWGMG